MRRMFSEKQIKEFIQFLSTDIAQTQINAMAVRKMAAPESTTLTDDEVEMIKGGVFIEGEFLGYKNPVLLPPKDGETNYAGLVITGTGLKAYQIVKSTKVISLYAVTVRVSELASIGYFNGKNVPNFPSNTGTYTLKCVDGVLTWVEDV